MKIKPTLHVNLHCQEGRGMFQLDLESLLPLEIEFLLRIFEKSNKGEAVEFGVEQTIDGRPVMRFTIGKAETVN